MAAETEAIIRGPPGPESGCAPPTAPRPPEGAAAGARGPREGRAAGPGSPPEESDPAHG
ncbi:hypothetical protein GCM10018781_29760 [Kitasatospora indigofera]|uniref:Uncharacterized protein n=1 Tax=Kitasatospora indigofera TaxID=67307 RepID=A0A919FPT9_9ACTN|nr:hypothetical protein GCM10018781_29760 [Kitasatospora indigofera]